MRDQIDALHDIDSVAFRHWFDVFWKALFPYGDLPRMTKIRLCAFTRHFHFLQQILSYADSGLEEYDNDGRNALY